MADFVRLAATAKRLIDKNGRAVSVRQVTAAAPPDPNKPWIPGAEGTVDTPTRGAFFMTDRSFVTGELVPETEAIILVAAPDLGAVVPIPKDRLVDSSDVWEITKVRSVKPADVAVIYELQVKR